MSAEFSQSFGVATGKSKSTANLEIKKEIPKPN